MSLSDHIRARLAADEERGEANQILDDLLTYSRVITRVLDECDFIVSDAPEFAKLFRRVVARAMRIDGGDQS